MPVARKRFRFLNGD